MKWGLRILEYLVCLLNLSTSSPISHERSSSITSSKPANGAGRFFAHEKLDVYHESLAFADLVMPWIDLWPRTAAVCDQLSRAVESVVTVLVKAVRAQRTDQGIYYLECSLGSVLECAACLDVALLRHLIDEKQVDAAKHILQSVARMEVGLRRSWSPVLREPSEAYSADTAHFFAHETLIVYQRSLELHESLDGLLTRDGKRRRGTQRVDELSTSLTINIAEGNGRFGKLDHSKFISIAKDCGTKLAAYLDLAAIASQYDVGPPKSNLREVMAMLSGLQGYLRNEERGGADEAERLGR